MSVNLRSRLTLSDHEGPVYSLTFTVDGKYCMSGGADKTIKLWNPHRTAADGVSPLCIKSYQGVHGYAVTGVAISTDNSRFASCGKEKTVFVWDVTTGTTTRRISGHDERVNCVKFNIDGTVIVSGSYDNTVKCWDIRSNDRGAICTLSDFKDSVTSLALTDDCIIAASVDGSVRSFDIRAGKMMVDTVHESVVSVSLSHDSNCLLLSCIDNQMRLLERGTGEQLAKYTGHSSSNYSIGSCFTFDDAYVVSGSEDGKIYVWDLIESKVVACLSGHGKAVCDVAFHPTENVLVSASFDGTCKVWK